MSEPAIIIENLTKRFGSLTAVDNLSLEVKYGELFGLLGPNGAGKTTLLNVLSTLLEPTEGGAQVSGFDVEHDSKNVRKIIGVCPQEPADELIKKIGMEDSADRKAKEYSGGMVRRVSTVMALIHKPKVALLDEPTVAMDPVSRRAVWDFIQELKRNGMAIVLTTHYMEEAEYLCDRVGIIDEGRLIALGTPKDLMAENNASDLEEVFIKLAGKKLREAV